MPEALIWAMFLLPLASFLLISALKAIIKKPEVAAFLSILTTLATLVLAIWVLFSLLSGNQISVDAVNWFNIPGSISIDFSVIVDPLTAVMLIVITSISLAVQVYSRGYMHADLGYARYYSYLSLFTASMIGL